MIIIPPLSLRSEMRIELAIRRMVIGANENLSMQFISKHQVQFILKISNRKNNNNQATKSKQLLEVQKYPTA